MTPDRRLDQLEPLMADSLQKIDRLIEGQGQILEIATRADQKADLANQKADIIAKGVADLTTYVQQGSTDVREDISDLKAGQEAIMQYLREKLS